MKFLVHATCNRSGNVLDTLYVEESHYLDASKSAHVAIGQLDDSNLDCTITVDCDAGDYFIIGLTEAELLDAGDYAENEDEFLEMMRGFGIVDAK
jgi:hypothetical protein